MQSLTNKVQDNSHSKKARAILLPSSRDKLRDEYQVIPALVYQRHALPQRRALFPPIICCPPPLEKDDGSIRPDERGVRNREHRGKGSERCRPPRESARSQ